MRNWYLWVGLFLLGCMLFISFVGPQFDFVDETAPEHRMRFYEDGSFGRAPFPPSSEDIFGTDREARDILSLLILGAKDTIKIVVLITVIRYIIAIPMAFFASTKKGLAYLVTNGWYSLFGSIPTIFAAILLFEVIDGRTVGNWVYWKILIIALIEVGRVSYIFSNEMYEISQKEFVKASMTIGTTPFQLSILHYLPTISQSLVVNFFNDLGRVTLLVGQLALFEYFIENIIEYIPGGGVFMDEAGYFSPNGEYDWFGLLSAARYEVIKAVWIVLFPAFAITLLLLTFQLLSEGFRKFFDQRATGTKSVLVGRVFERVGESFIINKRVWPTIILVLFVLVGMIFVSGKEKTITSSTVVPPKEVSVQAEKNDEEEDKSGGNNPDPFGDGMYKVENYLLEAKTESTTLKGGLFDKFSFIRQQLEEKFEDSGKRVYESDKVKLDCGGGNDRCGSATIYFKQSVKTQDEAFEILRDHLPNDVVIVERFQLDEDDYIFNLSSNLLKESYSRLANTSGNMVIRLKMSEEKGIFAAQIRFGHITSTS